MLKDVTISLKLQNTKLLLCLKFNYSDVTSWNLHCLIISIFLSLSRNWKIYSRNAYVLTTFEPPSPCTHSYAFVMTPPSPYLCTYFMDGPFIDITWFFIDSNLFIESFNRHVKAQFFNFSVATFCWVPKFYNVGIVHCYHTVSGKVWINWNITEVYHNHYTCMTCC